MIINGRFFSYVTAQLQMACVAENEGDHVKAAKHFALALDAC